VLREGVRRDDVAAAKTWLSQTSPGRPEREDSLSLSLAKTVNSLTLSLAFLENSRMTGPSRGTLRRKNEFVGDANLAITRREKLEFHYGRSEVVLGSQRKQVSTEACD